MRAINIFHDWKWAWNGSKKGKKYWKYLSLYDMYHWTHGSCATLFKQMKKKLKDTGPAHRKILWGTWKDHPFEIKNKKQSDQQEAIRIWYYYERFHFWVRWTWFCLHWLHVAGGCILFPWLSSNSLVTISKWHREINHTPKKNVTIITGIIVSNVSSFCYDSALIMLVAISVLCI